MRWVGHVTQTGEKRNAYGILVGKPEGKRPLGRRICRLVDNIKMNLKEIGWDGMGCITLHRIGTRGGSCEHCNEPLDSIKCCEVLE
jgi:hypothetical protein